MYEYMVMCEHKQCTCVFKHVCVRVYENKGVNVSTSGANGYMKWE